jgi:hypothetical protein
MKINNRLLARNEKKRLFLVDWSWEVAQSGQPSGSVQLI